ncbi:UPF0158 family protein [Streptomyces sp. Ncost-T10-10d]|uniref:UPF0158 family protein n=1 Tax=Streptomyces sp. Ncost-T10-10d TaxID=1839774 RepID=UPI00081F6D13|nr:UPF0158 family protein [Streptomyces sp. Ncost-T10-10d]SCF71479.1 Uncharacterised protein family (UPF0158) [Streptomyces sp. Ncost-T10-10d]
MDVFSHQADRYRPPTPPPLDAVFMELTRVVQSLESSGRSTRSAGIKPRLGHSLGALSFDESQYGFVSFRQFLEAAQQAGHIVLTQASSGPDLNVGLPGRPVIEPTVPSAQPDRIRADLWSTFMDWTTEVQRVYDRERQIAFRLRKPAEAYDPDVRRLVQELAEDPSRYVPIEPVSMATQTQWARDFSAAQPTGAEREMLLRTLDAERPLQEFTYVVRTLPARRDWQTYRNVRVIDTIKEWAARNAVSVDPAGTQYVMAVPPPGALPLSRGPVPQGVPGPLPLAPGAATAPAHPRVPAQPQSAGPAASPGTELATLRARVHDLVDHMTTEELLALPFTLGQLYRR